jgi:hypothetical protein
METLAGKDGVFPGFSSRSVTFPEKKLVLCQLCFAVWQSPPSAGLSFPRRRESSSFDVFWTPAFAGVTFSAQQDYLDGALAVASSTNNQTAVLALRPLIREVASSC